MKRYNSLYYLLFVLLIMGAFASMAQNSYGLKILGGVAILFGLTFLWRFIEILTNKAKKDVNALIELFSLFIFSGIFALRIFYIHFPNIELIFAIASVMLVLVYLRKMVLHFRSLRAKNLLLAAIVTSFYLSIVLFLISMIAVPFYSKLSMYTGGLAFALLVAFLAGGILRMSFLIEGENVSAFRLVAQPNDCSIILITSFFLFSLYTGFSGIGVIPRIYSDEYPQAYLRLVNNAETGKDQSPNGKYSHQEFKKKYDQFVEKNIINNK